MNKTTDFFSRLPKKWVIPPLVVAAILVSFLAVNMPDNNLHVSFLDVGQGDAILIHWSQLALLPMGLLLELPRCYRLLTPGVAEH